MENSLVRVAAPLCPGSIVPTNGGLRNISTLFGESVQKVLALSNEQFESFSKKGTITFTQNGVKYSVFASQITEDIVAIYREAVADEVATGPKMVRLIFEKEKLVDVAFGDLNQPFNPNGFAEFIQDADGHRLWGSAQALNRFFENVDLNTYAQNEHSELDVIDEDGDGDIDTIVSYNVGREGKTVKYVKTKVTTVPNNTLMLPDPKI